MVLAFVYILLTLLSALFLVQLRQVREHRVTYCAQQNAAHNAMRDAIVAEV